MLNIFSHCTHARHTISYNTLPYHTTLHHIIISWYCTHPYTYIYTHIHAMSCHVMSCHIPYQIAPPQHDVTIPHHKHYTTTPQYATLHHTTQHNTTQHNTTQEQISCNLTYPKHSHICSDLKNVESCYSIAHSVLLQ